MVGEGGGDPGFHLEVIGREPEALLLLDLLGRELDVHHRGVGDPVDGLLLDRQRAVDFRGRLLARHEWPRDLHLLDLERHPAIGVDFGIQVVLAAHVGVTLVDTRRDAVHVHLDTALGVLWLADVDGQRALDALQRRGADERLQGRIAAEADLRVVGEELEVQRVRGRGHRQREDDGEHHGQRLGVSSHRSLLLLLDLGPLTS